RVAQTIGNGLPGKNTHRRPPAVLVYRLSTGGRAAISPGAGAIDSSMASIIQPLSARSARAAFSALSKSFALIHTWAETADARCRCPSDKRIACLSPSTYRRQTNVDASTRDCVEGARAGLRPVRKAVRGDAIETDSTV